MPASLDTNKKTLDAINKSIKEQTRILSAPPKKDVEGDREKKSENKKFLDELKGIISSAVGGTGKAGKGAGKMLAKFLKFGLTAIMLPFLGLIGAIAGVFSGIMATPEVKFLGGIIKTIGKTALGFIKFMGSIAKWMLNLLPGGKAGTKIFGVFGKIGETMTGMLGRWGDKLAGIFKNPKIAAVMGKVSKFIKPLARIAIWLFSAYEFIKGWGKADQIFGKEEGGATIVEKFASGIGGVIDFLSFGLIEIEVAAVALKKTFDFFKLAVTKPGEAWKLVTKWWEDFSFDETIVQPMLKMFDNFPKMVRTFIDGPLSNFGSMAVTMLKDFVFGKKDPNAEEGDAKSGGLWGGIKSLFSAKNIAKAIKGLAKITVGFYKMLASLVLIPFIGTQGKIDDPKSWGGMLGWLKDRFVNIESEGDSLIMGAADITKSIGKWALSIFWHDDGKSGLLQSLMGWIEEKFKDIKFPDIDFSTTIKDMLRPIIKMKGMSLIFPDSLYDWVGEKKVKTVAEKLAEIHPGAKTKDEFMKDKKHGRVVDPKTGKMSSTSNAQKRAYEDYLSQLKKDEGFESKVYKDTEGIKTIGYGFNLERAGSQEALDASGIKKSLSDLKSGKVSLTEEEATKLMADEYGQYQAAAKRFVNKGKDGTWKNLSLDRQKVITNMAYNIGATSLNGFSKLRKAIQDGDYEEAGAQMSSSKWAGQVKGRSTRLVARMTDNTSGVQLASAATNSAMQERSNSGGSTMIKAGDTNNNQDTNYHAPSTPRNSKVVESHPEKASV